MGLAHPNCTLNGAYTGHLSIVVFRDCELRRATIDGVPAEFPSGASVRNVVSVGCSPADGGILVTRLQSEDGVTYTGEEQLYTLDVTAEPAPTLDPVAGWPKPVSTGPGTSRPDPSLTCNA